MNWQGTCWHCGQSLKAADYQRENRCPACGRATHACRNCRFFAPGRPNECLEPLVERVVEKERANFCDYFEAAAPRDTGSRESVEDLLKAAEDLFK
jgi:hypothetical protein